MGETVALITTDAIAIKMLVLGALILAAHFGGILSKRLRIGEVTGQILGGVLVGPHFLELVRRFAIAVGLEANGTVGPGVAFLNEHLGTYRAIFDGLGFYVFLFLGVIAFSIGEELHRDRIKATGGRGIAICAIQSATTWGLLLVGFLAIGAVVPRVRPIHAFLIGSIGIATAPAVLFVLMNQLRIEGRLRTLLANVVVFADFFEILVFSITLGIAVALEKPGRIDLGHVGWHAAKEFLLAIGLGVLLYAILRLLIPKQIRPPEPGEEDQERDFFELIAYEHPTPSVEIMLTILGVLAVGLSFVLFLGLPFLIVAVVAGMLISNFHSHALFDSLKLENVTAILNLLFFGIVGATVEIESFSWQSLYLILAYLVFRGGGKALGTWLGCRLTGQDPKITACLPLLMLPQAGIAAVETLLVAQTLSDGNVLFQIIIPAIVIFELGGAFLSERTLLRWKMWTVGEGAAMDVTSTEVAPGDYSITNLVGNRILYDLEPGGKEEAIRAIAKHMEEFGIVAEGDAIAGACLERETLSSTAVGKGTALAHCRTSMVDNVVSACAVLSKDKAIEWGSPDDEPVRLIFMLVSPDAKPEQNLHALHGICTCLAKPDFFERLEKAIGDREVAELFGELSPREEKGDDATAEG